MAGDYAAYRLAGAVRESEYKMIEQRPGAVRVLPWTMRNHSSVCVMVVMSWLIISMFFMLVFLSFHMPDRSGHVDVVPRVSERIA